MLPSTLLLQVQASSQGDFDVETILQMVRQAQRPFENMQIEWTDSDEYWRKNDLVVQDAVILAAPYRERIDKKWRAVFNGPRSVVTCRTEYYRGQGGEGPNNFKDTISIFDGTRQLEFADYYVIKLQRIMRDGTLTMRNVNNVYLHHIIFGRYGPRIYHSQLLERSEVKLRESEVPGIYILDLFEQVTANKAQHFRLWIDGNRGYHVIQIDAVYPDGTLDVRDKITLKQYPNGMWFPSVRETIRFGPEDQIEGVLEKRKGRLFCRPYMTS